MYMYTRVRYATSLSLLRICQTSLQVSDDSGIEARQRDVRKLSRNRLERVETKTRTLPQTYEIQRGAAMDVTEGDLMTKKSLRVLELGRVSL